jgi:Glycosyltransferase family 92
MTPAQRPLRHRFLSRVERRGSPTSAQKECLPPILLMALRSYTVADTIHSIPCKCTMTNFKSVQTTMQELMEGSTKFLKGWTSTNKRALVNKRNLPRYFLALVLSLVGIGNGFLLYLSFGPPFFTGYEDMPVGAGPRSWNNNEDIPLHAGLNNSVAACLLFMDDNHRLVEWLAYHYFVMPLRHVIVLPDANSRTSPMDVLERWKPYMTIEVWNDTYGFNASDPIEGHRDLVHRQERFYPECALNLRSRNRTWTMFIDVDEFWAIDETNVPDWKKRMGEHGAILKLIDEVSQLEPNTTLYNTSNSTLYTYQGTVP